jgi:hypothetical protein
MPTAHTATTVDLELTARALADRELLTPALLLLAGHKPLAFVAGQVLYGLAPIAALLGAQSLQAWAALLSAPDGPAQLQRALEHATSDRNR